MNKIVTENAIAEGRAPQSYWNVPHSNQIEGFATDISVNAGTRVDFKINVNGGAGSDYKVEIFRLGYYGGDGAREVAEWTNTNATVQPNALYDAARALVDAGNWSVTDSWDVPSDAVSGVYLARLQRLDANGNPIGAAVNQIPFIVRNDGVPADIVLQTSDTTWHAYNGWFGNNGKVGANFYGDASGTVNHPDIPGAGSFAQDRAYAVSYNRPFITRDGTSPASGSQDYLFGADYAAIYWLEKQGYDVSYISGVDTDRLGASYLQNYDAFISVGHDEYWSGGQFDNVEAARDAGVNLLFWSGNEVYWKTRWETAISADGTPYRTLVCYKETWAHADPSAGPEDYYNLDPSNIWTGTWRDTRFHGNPLAGGGNPQDVDPISGLNPACHCGENMLTGQLFGPDGTGQFGGALDVPAQFGALRVWRDTTVANGGKLDIAPGILGYEWDTSPEDNLRPASLIKLSDTTIPWNAILVDDGNTTQPGVATHNLSLYRDDSGALVFGAGTVFWSWALSNIHDSSPYGAQIENRDIQQFTINMFADMGIQPGVADAVLVSQGLKRATASSDTIAAVATINDLPDAISALSPVTITGTATDNDGIPLTADGRVAVVEVSVDGGANWRVATTTDGWATWSYTWNPTQQGNYTIRARAIDDSLNVANAVADTEAVTVSSPEIFSLFGGITPSGTLTNDGATVELGMRFVVDRGGTVTQLKYWRASEDAGDTDVREGHLWRADGTLLGTATFTSAPGASGWQTAVLITPVALAAGTEYVVSYRTANNYYSTGGFFDPSRDLSFDGIDNNAFSDPFGVLRAPQDGSGGGNGIYRYGTGAPQFPNLTYNSENYWVDVTFDPADTSNNRPPGITSASSFSSPENRLSVATVTATDPDANVLTYFIAGGADAAQFAIHASTGALSFVSAPNFEAPTDANPNNVYEVSVGVSDGIAAAVTQAIQVTVTDVNESGVRSNLFSASDAPATIKTDDPTDYELGMKFQSGASGWITDLRYFRGAVDAGDTDVRTLNLWTSAGVRIGQVTVTSAVAATGWQVGTLTTPVEIDAGTTYIVSYGTTQNYAYTQSYFVTSHTSSDGFLTGLASGSSGGNGVFANGTPGAFPTATFNSSNYWVDVTFQQTLGTNAPPTIAPIIAPNTNEDAAAVQINLLAGATDPEGTPISVLTPVTATSSNASRAVAFTLIPAGVLTLDPAQFGDLVTGQSEVVTISYRISDGINAGVSNTATITVEGRDDTVPGQTITGTSAADTLTGGEGPDTISGLGGNDTLLGLGGNDFIDGGSDNDTIVGFVGTDTVIGGAGTDTIVLSATSTELNSAIDGQIAMVEAVSAASAGAGVTIGLTAQTEAFTVTGSGFDDTINGGSGNDTLNGGAGADTMLGGAGNDTYVVDNTGDIVDETGTDGVDTVQSSITFSLSSATRVFGVVENLTLTGSGNNTGTGNGLDNVITGNGGNNVLVGGVGIDTVSYQSAASAVTVSLAITGAQVTLGAGTDTLTTFENLTGSEFDDTLTGSTAVNILNGLGGNDRLNGGAGADTMLGGAGNDTYVVDNTGDIVDETGADGVDTVQSSITFSLSSATRVFGVVENLTLTGSGNNTGTGNGLDNVITGNGGNNVLAGLGGADTLIGGLGTDTATYAASASGVTVSLMPGAVISGGDAEGDSLTEIENLTGSGFSDTLEGSGGNNVLVGGAGIDTVSYQSAASAVTVSLAITGAQVTLGAGTDTLTTFENLTGSEFDDTLTGSTAVNILNGLGGNDRLNGGAGADTMLGGAGNDTYVVDNTGDIVDETGADGVDTVQSSITFSLSSATRVFGVVENLTLTGSGNNTGTGNGLDNVITGNGGNNVLAGLGGADTLIGGLGTDTATYAASASGVTVSLMPGAVISGGDAEGNSLTEIENLTGSGFSDTLEGSGGNNVLVGGAGIDTVSYQSAASAVTVSLAITGAQVTLGAGTDTLTTFENLTGSEFDDTLTGSTAVNILNGLGGNDRLNGGAGADTMLGGAGDDTMTGGTGNDRMEFAEGFGHDTVMDFVAGAAVGDVVAISSTLFADFASLMANTANNASGAAVITFDIDNSITLANVGKASLNANDFLFI